MVKALVFKGEKRSKKRKAAPDNKLPSSKTDDSAQSSVNVAVEDDSWVRVEVADDLSGPIILVLPTTTPSCLACDSHGTIFLSDIENIIEKDPSTAEPHDVRQVWIINRVAGTDEFTFKGHHGKYLSCDSTGQLSATREAVSPEESYKCISSDINKIGPIGTFSIQTAREHFLCVKNPEDDEGDEGTGRRGKVRELKGDAELTSFCTLIRIRMQARFKPRHSAEKAQKIKEKVSRKELEEVVGRKLEDDEVRKLKRARMTGDYHEAILNVRVKGKHDKYA